MAASAPPTYSVQQQPAPVTSTVQPNVQSQPLPPLPLPTPTPVQHQLIAPVPVYPSVQPAHATGLLHPSAPYVPFFSHPQPALYTTHTNQPISNPSINTVHYPELRQSLIGHQY